jgi:hypothetical protein
MSTKTSWITALALLTATLTGCETLRADAEAPLPAPVAPAQTAPQVAVAPAAPAPPEKASEATRTDGAAKGATRTPSKSRAKAADVTGKLRIKRLVLADRIEGREPAPAKTSFRAPDSDRIYAFVEVENGAAEETEITVTFEPPDGGAPRGNVTLSVGASPRWRTWAFTRGARAAGEWTAVVRSPDGEELARTPFEVTL